MVWRERRSRDKFAGAKLPWFHETDICLMSRSLSRFQTLVNLLVTLFSPRNALQILSLSFSLTMILLHGISNLLNVIRYYTFIVLLSPRQEMKNTKDFDVRSRISGIISLISGPEPIQHLRMFKKKKNNSKLNWITHQKGQKKFSMGKNDPKVFFVHK